MDEYNFINLLDDELIFSSEYHEYYSLSLLKPNASNKILGDKNKYIFLNNSPSGHFFHNKFFNVPLKNYLYFGFTLTLFYLGALKGALAAPSSIKTPNALIFFGKYDPAHTTQNENSPVTRTFPQTAKSWDLLNWNNTRNSRFKAVVTKCIGGTNPGDQSVVNLRSKKMSKQILLSNWLTTQVPIVLTIDEFELKIQDKSVFLEADLEANPSLVPRKSSNDRFKQLEIYCCNSESVQQFFSIIKKIADIDLFNVNRGGQNDVWQKLVAMKNITVSRELSDSLENKIRNFRHFTQNELKCEIQGVIKEDFITQIIQSGKRLKPMDVKNDPSLLERFLIEDSPFAHSLVKGRFVDNGTDKTLIMEGLETPQLTYLHKNLINIDSSYKFAKNRLNEHQQLLTNIEASLKAKRDFSLTQNEATGVGRNNAPNYLSMFLELNDMRGTKIWINNPNEQVKTLEDFQKQVNAKNFLGGYSFLKTINSYREAIKTQKIILDNQEMVIENLLKIVTNGVSNSKQLSLKGFEECLKAQNSTSNSQDKNFIYLTSLFIYAPGFGPGCLNSGIAQQELLNYIYDELDKEIGKVSARQTVVPELYSALKAEALTIEPLDYSTFAFANIEEIPIEEINTSNAVLFDQNETITNLDPLSLNNPGRPSSAREMQTNVYYLLNDNNKPNKPTLICGQLKKFE